MTWSEPMIEALIRAWNQGYSASEIGEQLGVSRNAIIGKLNRLSDACDPRVIRRLKSAVVWTASDDA